MKFLYYILFLFAIGFVSCKTSTAEKTVGSGGIEALEFDQHIGPG